MKTVLEQLMEINAKLAELEKAVMGVGTSEFEPCCDDECGCGCDEPETEIEDNDITVEHGVSLTRGESITPDQAQMVVFTKAELVAFTSIVTERVIAAAKEAVTDTNLDTDSLVTLELNAWSGNTIDIELDKDTIVNSIHSEIDDTIDVDYDSIETEVDDILEHMLSNKQD